MSNSTTATPDLFQRYANMMELYLRFAPLAIWAVRIIFPIWFVIGSIGNPLSAVIWLGQAKRQNNSSAVYLGALAIDDQMFLILILLYILGEVWNVNLYMYHQYTCSMFFFMFYMLQYLSPFLVFGFTFERYIAVCHPFLKSRMFTVERAINIVMFLIVLSLAVASPQLIFFEYDAQNMICSSTTDAALQNFAAVWAWCSEPIIFFFIPLLILCFNILVLHSTCDASRRDVIRQQQNARGSNVVPTVLLLGVSFYYIITQTNASILYILEYVFVQGNTTLSDEETLRDEVWSKHFTFIEVKRVLEFLGVSQYACNFFIYFFTGNIFRKQVLNLLTCKERRPSHYRMTLELQIEERREQQTQEHGLPKSPTTEHNTESRVPMSSKE